MGYRNEYLESMFKLIKENPDLPIIPMVDSQIVVDEGFCSWMGSWGRSHIDEYYKSDERIYFKSEDEEELIQDTIDNFDEEDEDGNILTLDEIIHLSENIVADYDWIKCIAIDINTP